MVPGAFAAPAAAADGTIQGTITRAGGAPIQGTREVVGVKACPQGQPGPNCPLLPGHATSAQVGTGNWNLTLPPGNYDLYVITLGGAPTALAGPRPVTIPDGGPAPNESFEVALAVVEGSVTRNGVPFPADTAAVGACPSSETGPNCPSLRTRFADASGNYAIAVPPGSWGLRGFTTTPGAGEFSQETLDQSFADGALVAQNFNVVFGFAAGSVTVNGSPAGAGVGVGACKVGEQGPFCPSLRHTTTTASGNYSLQLTPGNWNVTAFLGGPSVFGPTQTVAITDGNTTTANLVLDFATLEGNVTDTNGAVISGVVFVGACPGTGPASEACPGLHAAPASGVNGSYSLLLEPGTYRVGAAHFTSGFPGPSVRSDTAVVVVSAGETLTCDFKIGGGADCDGIPDAVEDANPAGPDGNGDTIPDSAQANVTSLPSAGPGNPYVTIAAPSGTTLLGVEAIDPQTLPPPPAGVALPVGVLGFEVTGVTSGATVQVQVFGAATANEYWKVQNGTWVDFTANATGFGTASITLTLADGGAGDADGAANGTIVDPGAPVLVPNFDGFFSPVDNRPTVNAVKAGSGVPVKFSLGGDLGLGILADGYPKSQVIACDSDQDVDGIEETVAAGTSSLQYDASTDTYTYVWKTEKAWAGTCRQLVITLTDGSVHRANFKLT